MLSRREALRGGSAAVAAIAAGDAVAAAVPAVANRALAHVLPTVAGSAERLDPDLGHFRHYQRLKAVYDVNSAAASAADDAGDIETCHRLEDEGNDLDSEIYNGPERAIARTTATTLAGCIVQARLLTTVYVHKGDSLNHQDWHLARNLLAGLERLAGEAAS